MMNDDESILEYGIFAISECISAISEYINFFINHSTKMVNKGCRKTH